MVSLSVVVVGLVVQVNKTPEGLQGRAANSGKCRWPGAGAGGKLHNNGALRKLACLLGELTCTLGWIGLGWWGKSCRCPPFHTKIAPSARTRNAKPQGTEGPHHFG